MFTAVFWLLWKCVFKSLYIWVLWKTLAWILWHRPPPLLSSCCGGFPLLWCSFPLLLPFLQVQNPVFFKELFCTQKGQWQEKSLQQLEEVGGEQSHSIKSSHHKHFLSFFSFVGHHLPQNILEFGLGCKYTPQSVCPFFFPPGNHGVNLCTCTPDSSLADLYITCILGL